jgi:mono/diheme cytochrome c family protein
MRRGGSACFRACFRVPAFGNPATIVHYTPPVVEVCVKSRILFGVVATVAALFVSQAAFAQDKSAVDKGLKLYADQKCSMCHSIEGKGNAKGALDGVGTKLTADDIRAWLVTPKEMTAKTKAARAPAMKAYDKLDKGDLDALVAYMLSLKKK